MTPHTPDGWLDLSSYSVFNKTGNTIFLETSFRSRPSALRRTEYIGGGETYDAALNPNAIGGGISGGGPTGDPVSKGTGWLYSQFARLAS